jgi:hypothetical protein
MNIQHLTPINAPTPVNPFGFDETRLPKNLLEKFSQGTAREKTAVKDSKLTALEAMTAFQDKIVDAFLAFRHEYHSPQSRQLIRIQVYAYLAIYAKIEHEIFYPAIRQALTDKHLLPELQLTFDPLIETVKQLDFDHPDPALHEKNIYDLEKYFLHYIKAQRIEMFVKAEKLGLNTLALGEVIQKRQDEMLKENPNNGFSLI